MLYTFYPPLTASPWFYIGLVLVVAGSWIWCVLMLVAMREWKTRKSGPAGAAGHVRDGGECGAVALDHRRRGGRAAVSGHPGVAGPRADHRCGPGAHAVLMDAACHRLFLADPGLHRVLHDRAARGRRSALQRHHGPPHLHSVSALQPAGRNASSDDGSRARQRLEVHPGAAHRLRVGPHAADDLHHHGFAGDRRDACAAAAVFSAGSRRCHGTGRPSSRPALPS